MFLKKSSSSFIQREGRSIFIKYHGDRYREDMKRVLGMHQASLVSQKFLFPRPLDVLHDKQAIVYERLPPGQPLARYLYSQGLILRREDAHSLRLMYSVGQALASVHKYLQPLSTETIRIDLPQITALPDWDYQCIEKELSKAPLAAFHGDFSLSNIWLCKSDHQLVIIDPIPSRFCPNRNAGKTSIYYDIAHMLNHLWFVYPLWLLPFFNWDRPHSWVEAFLKGYEAKYEIKLHRYTVFSVTLWIFDLYFKYWKTENKLFLQRVVRNYFTKRRRIKFIQQCFEQKDGFS